MQRKEILLEADFTPGPGQLAMVFRDGGFHRILEGMIAEAGERVVVYELDRANEADLAAANALFSAFYVSGYKDPWPDELGAIEAFIPASGAQVLEICCGAGRLAPSLLRQGNQVTAVDLSEDCIREATARGSSVHYQVADALQLPFADKSFDVGCCLENSLGAFFSRRRQALSELVRVCRQRIVLGLREIPGVDAVQMYSSPLGFFEFSQPHSLSSFRHFLDLLPGKLHYRSGMERPWGGRMWFVCVELASRA